MYDMSRGEQRFKPLYSEDYELEGDNQKLHPEKKPWRERKGAV